MIDLNVKIDDRQLQSFMKRSPDRAHWALRESLLAASGHTRKEMKKFVERGGEGWAPLALESGVPLKALANLVRYKVTVSGKRGVVRGQAGFYWGRVRGQSAKQYKAFKARFKASFDMSVAQLYRIHSEGRSQRVTPAMRRMFAAMGHPLRKGTTTIHLPARPTVGPVWSRIRGSIPGYVEKKFFRNFFDTSRGPKQF